MFSLIISIIAIALVAALALASIYYGGSAFQEGSTDAEASTIVNQGQQIQGAVTLAIVDENWVTGDDAQHLVDENFLKEIPKVRNQPWVAAHGTADATVDTHNAEVCEAVNVQAGHNDGTDDAGGDSYTLPSTKATSFDSLPFGCYGSGTTFTTFYKL